MAVGRRERWAASSSSDSTSISPSPLEGVGAAAAPGAFVLTAAEANASGREADLDGPAVAVAGALSAVLGAPDLIPRSMSTLPSSISISTLPLVPFSFFSAAVAFSAAEADPVAVVVRFREGPAVDEEAVSQGLAAAASSSSEVADLALLDRSGRRDCGKEEVAAGAGEVALEMLLDSVPYFMSSVLHPCEKGETVGTAGCNGCWCLGVASETVK